MNTSVPSAEPGRAMRPFSTGLSVGGFSDAPFSLVAKGGGACRTWGLGVRAHQKGLAFQRLHRSLFSPNRNWLGNWLDVEIFLSGGTPLEEQELALLGRMDGPSVVPMQYVQKCATYREAVRLAWSLRRVKKMTQAHMAHFAELPAQHVSDYLAEDDKPGRRDLPAKAISRFEAVVGNTLVSQWVAAQSRLTVLEEMQATRVAA